MFWNEKIELIKKKYPVDEFSAPHLNRKEILRKIETKFIIRPPDYYDLNNSNERFSNWWNNLKFTEQELIELGKKPILELSKFIHSEAIFWIVAEFSSGVLIYKTTKDAALSLISIGRTWTGTFHLIDLKYESLISLKIEQSTVLIKKYCEKGRSRLFYNQ